jgi:hypothetical protein
MMVRDRVEIICLNWLEFETPCGIEGLAGVQFMLRDDFVIAHKSEDPETDHTDNKQHLCGSRAPIPTSIVLMGPMRMLPESVTFVSIVTS